MNWMKATKWLIPSVIVFAAIPLVGCMHRSPANDEPLRLLCAGQSNMAYTVARAEAAGWTRPSNLSRRLANASIHSATLFRSPQVAPEPAKSTPIQLERVTNQTASGVSALCLFSALEISERTKRRVEFVVLAVGGSSIKTWLRFETAEALGLVQPRDRIFFSDPAGTTAHWRELVEARLEDLPMPTGDWSRITVPGRWEDQGHAGLDGVVWLETRFDLPGGLEVDSALLSLGFVDDWDTTFLNDCRLGATFSWDIQRQYNIPKRCLRAGKNTLRIRVVDTGGSGGITRAVPHVELSTKGGAANFALAGDWWLAFAGPTPAIPAQPGDNRNTPSLLFNGMIAPLAREHFDAVIWYQGEADAFFSDSPTFYSRKLTALIADWRFLFNDPDLPFFVVQLPEFDPGESASPYAFGNIRLAQYLSAEADPTVTLVPALGLGVLEDIHPPNKTILAARVADAILGSNAPPSRCQLTNLRPAARAEPFQLDRCDKLLDNCQRSAFQVSQFQQLQKLDSNSGDVYVIGRDNAPSQWFVCKSGALSAQPLRARKS